MTPDETVTISIECPCKAVSIKMHTDSKIYEFVEVMCDLLRLYGFSEEVIKKRN